MSKGEGWGPFFPHRNFRGVCEAAASNADAVATPHPGASSYRFLLERFVVRNCHDSPHLVLNKCLGSPCGPCISSGTPRAREGEMTFLMVSPYATIYPG